MCRSTIAVFAIVLLAIFQTGDAGISLKKYLPSGYLPGQLINIRVNSLTSNQGVMPFPFYSVRTCQPPAERVKKEAKVENLGEILWGDKIQPSEYTVEMMQNVTCRKVCDTLKYDSKEMSNLQKRIEQKYRGNMVLDNLPAAQHTLAGPKHPEVMIGYPMGMPAKISPLQKTIINNHLHFVIEINEPEVSTEANEDTYRIVGFYVSAHSVDYKGKDDSCDSKKEFKPSELPVLTTDTDEITWTYSVSWVAAPDVPWATRWDVYLRGGENDYKIHWLSIINSLLIMVFLSGMVGMIMMRVLRKDFNRYNSDQTLEELQEEVGWKLVHGDVFRTPVNPTLLSALIGSGTQIAMMAACTLTFACMGFLAPSNRGALLTSIILSYVLVGSLAGYFSARLLKLFKRQAWKNAFFTGVLVPGFFMTVYLGLNFVQMGKHASSAIPFTTLVLLFALWFCCSLPLVLIGAAMGFRKPVLEMPCKSNAMPRMIPEQQFYLNKWFVIFAAGALPFGACFIEIVYILSAFWQGRAYYLFGFLAVVFLVLCVTCTQVAIVLIYFQLCYEDYHWWWRSFLLCASSGGYLFYYTIYYLASTLLIRQVSSIILYLGYMFLMSSLFAVATGTIGFHASFWFVRKIYGSIKID